MLSPTLSIVLLAGSALASPLSHQLKRQTCPSIHIFGARETTASPGYGSAGQLVDNIISSNPGATSEAIDYPASGDNPSYAESRQTGVSAVNSQVAAFAEQCPDTKLVLVGYSQGAEIFDLALCEGTSISQYNIVAAIMFGAPTFNAGASFDVGTCSAGGFDSSLAGTTCGSFESSIQSYCDSADPYCCTGSDANVHNGYEAEYGADALSFVNSKLASAPSMC
ncbi:uncharacterized protein LTR77_000633 [Saxophila tyrrhenica]|uniref:Acetylxylan esterase 2 n=1 Tax=Saxophila tyrrhenica TaxID=1690608 RepID=A0AAV9PR58_9PEZI|nr:hypothetical protein LTR77_000633 [Saxophila tyrrhenica]